MASGVVPDRLLAMQVSEAELRSVRKPAFVNTVVTYSMSTTALNPELVTLVLPGFCFRPQQFAAIKMRLIRSMILGFCGGIAVCPGSRDVESARIAALRFCDLLLRAGFYVEFSEFKVQNIVMSVYAPFEINLPAIRARYSQCTEYKNSNFPGLSFRMGPETNIVFNVFVTGRVVITGSRDPDHSYRAWWWLYTHVLVHCRMSSAPGTTSSARFRMSLHLRSNQFNERCESLSTRYARREDGPLARSKYADMLATPTMRTPVHTPSTPRTAVARRLSGPSLYLDRVNRHFASHSLACPFVRVDSARERTEWFDVLRHADALEGVDQYRALVEPHLDSGCVAVRPTRDSEWAALARRYVQQLSAAIGARRCRSLLGPTAPLRGHSIECPWFGDDDDDDDDDNDDAFDATSARHELECALALAVGDERDYSELQTLVSAHYTARCNGVADRDTEDYNDALVDDARMFIVQLHSLDDESRSPAPEAAAAAADTFERTHPCDLTPDDVAQPEMLLLVDMIRRRAAERRSAVDDRAFTL